MVLEDGQTIDCDVVVLSLGSGSPTFPFLPDKYRALLESESDGVQLYRHLLHPEVPRIAFAGFNHGFMHVPAVEIGMLWLSALLAGDLTLPIALLRGKHPLSAIPRRSVKGPRTQPLPQNA